MYTLRIIEEFKTSETSPWQQSVTNIEIGNSYTLFKGFHPMVLKAQDGFNDIETKEKLLCVIHGGNEKEINIWKSEKNINRSYFVLTECGTTFERIK